IRASSRSESTESPIFSCPPSMRLRMTFWIFLYAGVPFRLARILIPQIPVHGVSASRPHQIVKAEYSVTRYIAHNRRLRKGQFACQADGEIDFFDDRYIAANCYRTDSVPFKGDSCCHGGLRRKPKPTARNGSIQ